MRHRIAFKETAVGNPFVEFELNTTDVAAAKAFYSRLFNWRLDDDTVAGDPYVEIETGGEVAGGIVKNPVSGDPSAWIPYVAVDDVADATQRARSLGATIWKGATDIPGHGTYSIIADPTGAVLGLWTDIAG